MSLLIVSTVVCGSRFVSFFFAEQALHKHFLLTKQGVKSNGGYNTTGFSTKCCWFHMRDVEHITYMLAHCAYMPCVRRPAMKKRSAPTGPLCLNKGWMNALHKIKAVVFLFFFNIEVLQQRWSSPIRIHACIFLHLDGYKRPFVQVWCFQSKVTFWSLSPLFRTFGLVGWMPACDHQPSVSRWTAGPEAAD